MLPFFGRFEGAVVLQNRAPAQGKHTFVKNLIFYVQERSGSEKERKMPPKCLPKAPQNRQKICPGTKKVNF